MYWLALMNSGRMHLLTTWVGLPPNYRPQNMEEIQATAEDSFRKEQEYLAQITQLEEELARNTPSSGKPFGF